MIAPLLLGAALAFAQEQAVTAAFDPVDATAGLQAAIRSKAPLVRVPYTGKPWLVDPIELESDQEVVFDTGVVVMARAGSFRGARDALFKAHGKSRVTLRGYGASLVMRKQDYQSAPYEPSEWRHAVSIRSSTGVKILGLRISSSGGDGVYIGRIEGRPGEQAYSKDVELRDVVSEDHLRQGLSVISVDGLLVSSCAFTGTKGAPPSAGVDFEPNYADERLTNVRLESSRFDGNASYGLLFFLSRLSEQSLPVAVSVSGCEAGGNRHGSIAVVPGKKKVSGLIVVQGSTLSGPRSIEDNGRLSVSISE